MSVYLSCDGPMCDHTIAATDLRQKDPCRLWAIENGYPVEKHGRISNRIREEYEAYLESNRVAAAILEQQQRRTA